MKITKDNIPGYNTRSFPELDEIIMRKAEECWVDMQALAAREAALTVEYDERTKGNPFAYMLRPMQASAEQLWNLAMANSVPVMVEWHRASLGVQRVNADGTMNPNYKP